MTQALRSPDSVLNQLRSDNLARPQDLQIDGFQERLRRILDLDGFDFSVDYNALGFWATDGVGRTESGSGVVRAYGKWDLVGRDTKDVGRLVFKMESRHKYSVVEPTAFAGELGYAGSVNPVFSNQNWRVTHLHWQQNWCEGQAVCFVGFLDVTDYVDVYAMASPWTQFSNLAFSTGSGSIAGLPDGALGTMIGGFLTEKIYAVASVADANGDATNLLGGFDSFFNDFETFTSLELGVTTAADRLFLDNAHVTFWHIDSRQQAGTPGGWGVNGSITKVVNGSWLPFIRGGWANRGGSLYESTISVGLGQQNEPGKNLTGIGVNWSRPNRDTFGQKLPEQFTAELFQRIELTARVQLTPSLQIIGNPALNPDNESLVLFGLRARLYY